MANDGRDPREAHDTAVRERRVAALDPETGTKGQSPGDRLKAAIDEIRRRGRQNVGVAAIQAADRVEGLATYCAEHADVDLYAKLTGDREQDHALLRSLAVEQAGVAGWTADDWWRLLETVLTLGGIVLGLAKGDGAQALLTVARVIDAEAQPWW